jgi:hypothetical protein
MVWKRRWPILILVSLFGVGGCGKSAAPVPVSENNQSTTSPSAGPTTQELAQEFMAAPFVDLALRPLPLQAKVPRSWGVETTRGTDITMLRGPGPDAHQLYISLSVLMSMTPDRMNLTVQAAQRDAKKDPATLKCDVRQTTDMQILEIVRTINATTQPEDQPVDWRITFFAQHDLNYDSYVLSVIGLTQKQYEQSKDLLRRIIDSVTYVPPKV